MQAMEAGLKFIYQCRHLLFNHLCFSNACNGYSCHKNRFQNMCRTLWNSIFWINAAGFLYHAGNFYTFFLPYRHPFLRNSKWLHHKWLSINRHKYLQKNHRFVSLKKCLQSSHLAIFSLSLFPICRWFIAVACTTFARFCTWRTAPV